MGPGDNSRIEVHFTYHFESPGLHYFAYKIPWTYEDAEYQNYRLKELHLHSPRLHFSSEVLTKSPEERNIHLLCISGWNEATS